MDTKELYPWVSVIVVVLGFVGQGFFGSFRLGQAVEQVKAALKKQIDDERDKIILKLEELEQRFDREQKSQDHNFGEVGAAVRQYIANVEKEMHEIEIWARDNFVLKDDFVKATDRLEDAIKAMAASIKSDFRDLTKKIDEQH